jgi:methyl-accepting chemotaxis protein
MRNIRTKVTLVAGICLLVTAGAIITYSALAMKRNTDAVRKEAIAETSKYALAVARQYASYIRGEFQEPLDTSLTLANTLSGIKDDSIGLDLDRDVVN